ncbi:Mg-protoporphyrin IX methyltransferase [Roseovarius tolerans]|uniref:Magnesium protoporphyrin IX methyltransferase n=1 Tax=Roseovarius tolerans TaxID=74031 RepID=A0A1H8BCK5_9RHOB|nr:magnesium protoporphyrin IX methyltransferase [Roseovarius tolerans]SEM80691.1 Mg-protoporphyrin IX methyltransferase [Roseovarius tolerans]
MSYDQTLARVETYFDRTATRAWEALTSDAPVSKIRQTVREGRDTMRAQMLARLPDDLRGARILDAGCGAGQMTAELAARGADVVAVDISPALVEIAQKRLDTRLKRHVSFHSGDMLAKNLGRFDHVLAMDSLIYYTAPDLARALTELAARTSGGIIFTVAPRTPLLMAMWRVGKLFPRADRSPVMVPHSAARLAQGLRAAGSNARLTPLDRIARGFYISQAMEVRG